MKIWENIKKSFTKSFADFKEDIGSCSMPVWKNWEDSKEASVKNVNPRTYDRYDVEFGLHDEPKETEETVDKA